MASSEAAARPSGRGPWVAGALALALAVPLTWFVATRPLLPSGTRAGAPTTASSAAAGGVAPRVNHAAPDFALSDPAGRSVALTQFRGKALLLNFWATWCDPCREEMAELEQLYRQYQDKGLVVLGISVDSPSSAKHVPEYLQAGNPRVGAYTLPVALDTKQEVLRAYNVTGVPWSFFLDGKGIVRAVQPGAMSRQMMLDHLRAVLPFTS